MKQFKCFALDRMSRCEGLVLEGKGRLRAGRAPRRSVWLLAIGLLCLGLSGLQAQTTPAAQDCTDPSLFGSSTCKPATAAQPAATGADPSQQGSANAGTRNTDQQGVYVDSAGNTTRRTTTSSDRSTTYFPQDPLTDLQRLANMATGESLKIFGRDLFQRAPSTFAPADQIPITSDYVIGPNDEVLVRLWGPESLNSQLTVDPSGNIYIPKVGAVHVAGLRYDELQKQIVTEVNHVYRNYNLSVSLGRLRSIQVYVVGEAMRPGAYTVSSLTTVLNALLVSGGPNVNGSLRHIQVRRNGQPQKEFDLYDLVLHGDKSQDLRLETGDTIFIPPVGAQIALAGSVRHPAVYELKSESTLKEILDLAGGFSAIGAPAQIMLERIETDRTRHAMNVKLDAAGLAMVLRDGDVLFANHITAAYEKSVTIRGNLANAGRFAWHDGMKLSDIIPDKMSLLTLDYWRDRDHLGVPVPLFEPLDRYNRPIRPGDPDADERRSMGQIYDQYGNPQLSSSSLQYGQYGQTNAGSSPDGGSSSADTAGLAQSGVVAPQNTQTADRTDALYDPVTGQRIPTQNATSPGTLAQPQVSQMPGSQMNADGTPKPKNRIKIPAPEIDWSYAVIERLNKTTLKSELVPFNLGRLVLDHDATQDLTLQAGDVVTILSQADVQVPLDAQTKFVRLEGEFVASGVYSAGPNETLDELVARAGGLSPRAYLYGSSFTRESARLFQQQRLDEYISTLATDMERSAAVRAASSASGILDPNSLAEQRSLVAQLRQLKATGRIVLEFGPTSTGVGSIPKIPLENNDVFRIPSRPNTVSVIGAVYGQNVFLFDPNRHLEDYVALAGKPNRIADRRHAFIIRADGSIFSRERAQGVFSNSFESARINPGDSIVIPEKLIKQTALKQLIDFSQVLSSFGLAAAAINVVR